MQMYARIKRIRANSALPVSSCKLFPVLPVCFDSLSSQRSCDIQWYSLHSILPHKHLPRYWRSQAYGPWIASKMFDYQEMGENLMSAFYLLQQMVKDAWDEKGKQWDSSTFPRKTTRNVASLVLFSQVVLRFHMAVSHLFH